MSDHYIIPIIRNIFPVSSYLLELKTHVYKTEILGEAQTNLQGEHHCLRYSADFSGESKLIFHWVDKVVFNLVKSNQLKANRNIENGFGLVIQNISNNSHKAETDFCGDSVLKLVHSYSESDLELKLLCSESDQVRHVLEMLYGSSCLENILIYNTFFDKHVEPWIRNSQFAEKFATCSLERDFVFCFDPGILMSALSVQDRQVQSRIQSQRSESIDRDYKP
ncbi:hypothetical protein YC2023_007439 [Brassica napus]